MKVNHKLFGQGQLTSIEGKIAICIFNGEVKKLDLRFANLTDSDGNSITYTKPKKEKAAKLDKEVKSIKGTPDFDILFELGVVDVDGFYLKSDLDVLIESKIEEQRDSLLTLRY